MDYPTGGFLNRVHPGPPSMLPNLRRIVVSDGLMPDAYQEGAARRESLLLDEAADGLQSSNVKAVLGVRNLSGFDTDLTANG